MIKYGLDTIDELKFTIFTYKVEVRNQNWIDIILIPTVLDSTPLPEEIVDFSILVITNYAGQIAQIVPQDIGCDSEYQLTFAEKEQVNTFIYSQLVQQSIILAIEMHEQIDEN